ncbi:MAG: cupin domain-containing protein [Candidatus Aquilonibacter sp.]
MFYKLSDIAPQDVYDGYRARIFHGDDITFAVLEIAPNAKLPTHRHTNEQVGMLVLGSLTFNVGEETRTLGAGEAWAIPSNTDHDAAAGPEGATVIETWSPPRADFRNLPKLEASTPSWP